MLREHDRIELEVVPDLPDRVVFEERFHEREGGVAIEPRPIGAVPAFSERREEAFVRPGPPHRHIAGMVRTRGKRQADDPGAHRGGRVGKDAQAEPSRARQLSGEPAQSVERLHRRVVLADGCGGRRELEDERPEPEAREQLEAPFARRAAIPDRVGLERHGDVGADPRQFAALPGVLGVVEQAFPVSLVADLGCMRQQLLDRTVGGDEIARALLADAGNALDVVDRIPHQREHVYDLRRRDPELLLHAVGVVPRAIFLRVVNGDAVVHQLEEVLVTGDDGDLEPGFDGPFGKRADHVVGFEAREGENRDAEGFTRFVDPRNLLGEIRRHRGAVGLVVGRHLGPECRAGQVERRGDVLRRMIGDELAQHRHEDVDRVGRFAGGPGQAPAAHRVIRAIHLRAAVDQKNARGRGHRIGDGREKPREERVYHSRNVVGSGEWPVHDEEGPDRGARRPAGKARRPRILTVFEGGATPPAGMPRPRGGPSSSWTGH